MSYSYQITKDVLEKFLCDPDETDLEIEIPEEVKEIADRAFEGCESIKSVRFLWSVEKIGEYAFHNCTHLVSCIKDAAHRSEEYFSSHPEDLKAYFEHRSGALGKGAFSGCTCCHLSRTF